MAKCYSLCLLLVIMLTGVYQDGKHSIGVAQAAQRPTSNPLDLLKCVTNLKKKHPSTAGKLTQPLLELLCDKPLNWGKKVNDAKRTGAYGKPPKGHTKEQVDYFNSLSKKKNPSSKNGPRGKRQTTTSTKCIRKECRRLTDQERTRLQGCFKTLKQTMIGTKSKYDIIADNHQPAVSPEAHGADSFLCFHRNYLNTFENALQEIDPLCCLCYWDSSLDQPHRTPQFSVWWSDFMAGTHTGVVTTGWCPWTVSDEVGNIVDCPENVVNSPKKLCRKLDTQNAGGLFYDKSIFAEFQDVPLYQSFSYCRGSVFELLHGGVHVACGGNMADIAGAPYDCLFWMHHANIDCIWQRWVRTQPELWTDRNTHYDNTCNDECKDYSSNCNASSPMLPFQGVYNIDGLSPDYTSNDYDCEDAPVCNADKIACDPPSPYLFCDRNANICVSKIMTGGDCSNYKGQDCCYQSTCGSNGKCGTAASSSGGAGGGAGGILGSLG